MGEEQQQIRKNENVIHKIEEMKEVNQALTLKGMNKIEHKSINKL